MRLLNPFLLLILFGTSCINDSKLEITSEYLIYNSACLTGFHIIQILPEDGSSPPVKYLESSSFKYGFVTDGNYEKKDKIFFSVTQKGFKWVSLYDYDGSRLDTIGKLGSGWYLVKGLHKFGYLYYVRIDSKGKAEVFIVNKANF
jgi:hypothetical protein